MSKTKGVHRRDFIKLVGATASMAASGCGQRLPEKIIPYVFQPTEIIPGVAAWYSGTCGGCAAGCGWLVRTREGRAVKVEGNAQHPVNQGGLCARGQARLQRLYDPDRVRAPLSRRTNQQTFSKIDWKAAVTKGGERIKSVAPDKRIVLISKPLSASIKDLIDELLAKNESMRLLEIDSQPKSAMNKASDKIFDAPAELEFDFARADCIVSCGADYLATWGSPVSNATKWAKNRNADSPTNMSYTVQIEPRLSLTGANADLWVKNTPGSEAEFMFALLREIWLLTHPPIRLGNSSIENDYFLSKTQLGLNLENTGVSQDQVKTLANKLFESSHPLVIADVASTDSKQAEDCALAALLINVYLGALGNTVFKRKVNISEPKYSEADFSADVQAKNVDLAIILDANPVYTAGSSAAAKILSQIPFVVAAAASLDETALLANLILPLSSELETWWDSEPQPGVFNLSQPAMQPLYPTQGVGDVILALANAIDVQFEGVTSFVEYMQQVWEKRTGSNGFESRWLSYVQHGGDWSNSAPLEIPHVSFTALHSSKLATPEPASTGLSVMAFSTISGSDGQGADSPWLQELPDPLTTVVWGSWCEMHPETAKAQKLNHGDVIQLQTDHGVLELPLYVHKHIHPNLLAVPLGLGRTQGNRFAQGVGAHGASILPDAGLGVPENYLVRVSSIKKSISSESLIEALGHRSQEKRGLIRQKKDRHSAKTAHHHKDKRFPSHQEHDPHALGPHKQTRQMYEQMEHVGYRWGMSIDLAKCIGCSACVVACYAENNIPVVGKKYAAEGREMSWLRIDHYEDGPADRPVSGFMPMMCQHCNNAPCEPVCPVYATYHNEDGLNAMVYNRCVGTRYCSNNCSYKVRRFNWFGYDWPEPMTWQLNPDVTVREVGIMEKCSFCIQRISEAKNNAKNNGVQVQDGEVLPACASSCPTSAIRFGNLLDKNSEVYQNSHNERAYKALDAELNTQPAISYLAKVAKPGNGKGKV